MLPSEIPKLPRMGLCPYLFCLSYLLYFVPSLFRDNGLRFWCLMFSASIQKLSSGICSVFKCSFNKLVGEKVVSPSYSSAILASPLF